jgi:hypothetical protein
MVREHDPEGVPFEYEDLERSMSNPDEDTLLRAMEDSRRILADYVALGDPTLAVDRLLAVLDRDDVVRALDRLKRRRLLRLVE